MDSKQLFGTSQIARPEYLEAQRRLNLLWRQRLESILLPPPDQPHRMNVPTPPPQDK